jgi:hypothetical protein
VSNPGDINGGINHFGSPFNFSEEFVSVYRLHPMVPDILEYRDIKDPNQIQKKIPVIDTFRGKATAAMREGTFSRNPMNQAGTAPPAAPPRSMKSAGANISSQPGLDIRFVVTNITNGSAPSATLQTDGVGENQTEQRIPRNPEC